MTNSDNAKPRIGIVLSGYPQAVTLASGAMLGFQEKGIEFDVISTSGPGALVGLLALAPRGNPKQALGELPNIYTSDLFYRFLPINVRIDTRNSPFAKPMYRLRQLLPRFNVAPDDPAVMQRLFNSWMDFAVNAITPGFEWTTPGLLSHSPLLQEMICFEKLRTVATRFYMSTFDLDNKQIRIFDNQSTTVEAFLASQSSPLFYPPQHVFTGSENNDNLFYSSLNHDATALQAIWLNAGKEGGPKLDMVLAFDPITDAVWREPTNIFDAFNLMLANPIAALQVNTFALYAQVDRTLDRARNAKEGRRLPPLYRIPVPLKDYPRAEILKWTHSNALALQEIGRRAATGFADVLLSGDKDELERLRFFNLKEDDNGWDIMQITRILSVELERQTLRAGGERQKPRVVTHSARGRTGPASAFLPRTDANWWEHRSGLGILVGGGAPNLQLSAGALCAFYENKISFDIIGASGAGALPGLLYAAPAVPGSQVHVLQETVNLHIADEIEHVMPYNYKIFFKPGPFAQPAWQLGQSLPRFRMHARERYSNDLKRLYNDTLDLMISMMTPSTLNFGSKAMLSRVGMFDKAIAWKQLPNYPKEFYLSTFNLKTQRLDAFSKSNLTAETFWAALAMPWLFAPTKVGNEICTEGASHDPTGLLAVLKHWNLTGNEEPREAAQDVERPRRAKPGSHNLAEDVAFSFLRSGISSKIDQFNPRDIDKIIALETVGSEMWSDPETIREAIQVTIMDPIVTLSEVALATYGLFEWVMNKKQSENCVVPPLYGLPFKVPDWEVRNMLRFNYSNALTLWNSGHSAATSFIAAYRGNKLECYRYYPCVKNNARVKKLLSLYSELLAKYLGPDGL